MEMRKKARLGLVASLACVQLAAGMGAQPAQAAYTTTSTFGGKVNVMSKYYVNNNTWGYSNNGWGGGTQSVGADPAANTGYWRTDFNWWNNSNVAWDQYHIKAFPSIVMGWQWGYGRSDHGGLPRPLNWNSNIWTEWSYSTANVASWSKYDAVYDMWVDYSDNTSHPSDEIMVFLNYTAETTPTGGYQGDVYLAGRNWSVYRSTGDWQIISFVAKDKTTYFNGNLRDFLNYVSQTKNWVDRNKQLLSVQAGFEIWYGQGYFQTWGYKSDVS